MKEQRFLLLFVVLLLCTSIISCSPGHLGGNEIAFVRAGQLWTIDPDGANAYMIVAQATPVIGYSWSPTHQLLAFRTLDADYARTSSGKHLVINAMTQMPGDTPSDLNTVGIDGGVPIPIVFSSPDVMHSNAWWNTNGNRLLYREEPTNTTQSPSDALWWVSQNDQPGGIARKLLPASLSIPSISPDSSLVSGIATSSLFTTTLSGTSTRLLPTIPSPDHILPAPLERALWQPAHTTPGILYAVEQPSPAPKTNGAASLTIALLLRQADGQVTTLTTCACAQFAWSPNGDMALYSSGTGFTVLNIQDLSTFSLAGETGSVPYWSPDSRFLLLDGQHTLTLVDIAQRRQQSLLNDGSGENSTQEQAAPVTALLQPAPNSLWSADSHHFLFLTKGRLLWQGQSMSAGNGLYTVTIDTSGQAQSAPALIDRGNDTQAGWSFEDANTSFLF